LGPDLRYRPEADSDTPQPEIDRSITELAKYLEAEAEKAKWEPWKKRMELDPRYRYAVAFTVKDVGDTKSSSVMYIRAPARSGRRGRALTASLYDAYPIHLLSDGSLLGEGEETRIPTTLSRVLKSWSEMHDEGTITDIDLVPMPPTYNFIMGQRLRVLQ
jgi:hypothetical protein